MKKLIALLLALTLVFSLAACASSDKGDGSKEKPEQSAAPAPDDEQDEAQIDDSLRVFAEEYDNIGNALTTFDTESLLAAIAPNLDHEALTEALQLIYQIGVYSEAQLFDELDYSSARDTLPETYGADYHIETTMKDAVPLTDAQMKQIRDLLSDLQSGYEQLVESGENASDADFQEAAERDGLTVEQELRMIELFRMIRDSLSDCEITEGYAVTLSNEITGSLYDGVDTREGHITVIKLNGEWMLLDGLVAFAVLHPTGG